MRHAQTILLLVQFLSYHMHENETQTIVEHQFSTQYPQSSYTEDKLNLNE